MIMSFHPIKNSAASTKSASPSWIFIVCHPPDGVTLSLKLTCHLPITTGTKAAIFADTDNTVVFTLFTGCFDFRTM